MLLEQRIIKFINNALKDNNNICEQILQVKLRCKKLRTPPLPI